MDSNVSKNTNSHKFFKILLNQEKFPVSLRNLLKQLLLSTCDLYQQKFNVHIKHSFIATILDSKITLVSPKSKRSSAKNDINPPLFKPQLIPIKYSCPLGLILVSHLQLSLKIVTANLEQLFIEQQNNLVGESKPKLQVELVPSGWLNFYWDSQTIENWLDGSLFLIQNNVIDNNSLWTATKVSPLDQTPDNLFPAQYIHGRCCSLLRLGAREKLINLQDNFGQINCQFQDPQSISWLDREHNLWFTEPSASNLLRQLLMVTDTFAIHGDDHDWIKIALALSRATAIFEAECRFFGEIQQQYPQKAIARLGLIAVVQYWLHRILLEKLHIMAATEL